MGDSIRSRWRSNKRRLVFGSAAWTGGQPCYISSTESIHSTRMGERGEQKRRTEDVNTYWTGGQGAFLTPGMFLGFWKPTSGRSTLSTVFGSLTSDWESFTAKRMTMHDVHEASARLLLEIQDVSGFSFHWMVPEGQSLDDPLPVLNRRGLLHLQDDFTRRDLNGVYIEEVLREQTCSGPDEVVGGQELYAYLMREFEHRDRGNGVEPVHFLSKVDIVEQYTLQQLETLFALINVKTLCLLSCLESPGGERARVMLRALDDLWVRAQPVLQGCWPEAYIDRTS